jgi:OmpA-OmpF porin, OOP family
MRITTAAAAAVFVAASGPATAFSLSEQSPYFAAQYLFELSDSARDSDNGHGFQLTLGMDFPFLTGFEAEVSYSDLGRKRNIDRSKDYTSALSFDLLRGFGTFGYRNDAGEALFPQIKPFGLLGLAVVEEDVAGDRNYHAGANAGVGALIDLGYRGVALRSEARVLAQSNSKSVPSHSSLFDYRLTLGVQVPFAAVLPAATAADGVPPPPACALAVVDPVTGRTDCGDDADGDGVIDSLDQCPGTLPGTVVDATGCPVALTAQVIRGVNFETASAVLLPESMRILDGTAEAIKGMNDPNVLVEIGGHTDDVGSQAYNLMLSQQRAESVRQYLIGRGVDAGQLTAQGYGKSQPVSDNDSEEGRAQNRRVEFRIVLR